LLPLKKKIKNGLAAGQSAVHSLGISQLDMLMDPLFYEALYDILSERFEFLKYALVHKIYPAVQNDLRQLYQFLYANGKHLLESIYKHQLYHQLRDIVSSYLVKMNVDKQYHQPIMNAIVGLFIFSLLVLVYCILKLVCGCLCPREKNYPSIGTQPVDSSQIIESSQSKKQVNKKNKNKNKAKGSPLKE